MVSETTGMSNIAAALDLSVPQEQQVKKPAGRKRKATNNQKGRKSIDLHNVSLTKVKNEGGKILDDSGIDVSGDLSSIFVPQEAIDSWTTSSGITSTSTSNVTVKAEPVDQ